MPLQPDMQSIVDLVNAASAEGPPLSEQSVEMRRQAYLDFGALLPAGPDVAKVENVSIPRPGGEIPLRVYRPHGRDAGTGGVLVYYHGGGWCIGDLDTHDGVCRELASQSGSVVVAVDYRLAPEARFPAAIDDAWTALQWVRNEASTLVGIKDGASRTVPIAVCGDSAGANLAAVVAVMSRDADLPLAAQLLVYPAVDFRDPGQYPSQGENGVGYILTREGMDWFEDHYQADVGDWRASVIAAPSHEGLAPALVITAEFDPLRDEGEAYAKVLEAAGVAVTQTRYDGMAHTFFRLHPVISGGAEAIAQVAKAARKALA